ncbi:MAG: response regulator [Synergistaceae bacterium]|jgi:putative two-component system response regulator|nr:response regulator [Synergistaceae bacterium]
MVRKNGEEQPRQIVLAVDDLPSNLTKIKEVLGTLYDIRLAKNAPMALSMMNRIHVDLVLLDIEMPCVSGFDFMDICRNDTSKSKIPVIFVTSHATEEFVVRAARAGVRDYIAKPFDPHVLLAKVYDVIGCQCLGI